MNLNLIILKDYLPDTIKSYFYGERQTRLVCTRPYLCETGQELEKGNTYLLPSNLLPFINPKPDCSIICIGSTVPYNWQTSGTPILHLTGNFSFSEVFNEICKIYDKFDRWENTLYIELNKQADFNIMNILKAGAEIFRNSINVTDHSLHIIFEVLWETNAYGKKEMVIRSDTHTLGPEKTEDVKKVCNLERQISIPYISSIQNTKFRSYCNNLYPLGYFTGCVSISESEHPFKDSDFILADYYFAFFQSAFEKYLHGFNSQDNYKENALYKLIHHTPLTPSEYEELIPSSDEMLYCFKLKETNRISCMPKDYMHAALCTFLPQISVSTIYHQHIIGLLRIKKDSDITAVFLSFKEMLERMNYRTGISISFQNLENVEEALIQADYCLSNGEQTLNFFSDKILSFLCHEFSSRISQDLLTTEALRRVISYDKRKNTEYMHTLKVYLENEMDITPTAQKLFIHRSSLIKRLDKLTSLLQDDLTDSKKRLYYRLWFLLDELS